MEGGEGSGDVLNICSYDILLCIVEPDILQHMNN